MQNLLKSAVTSAKSVGQKNIQSPSTNYQTVNIIAYAKPT